MTVLLGYHGQVELRRSASENRYDSEVKASDVNTSKDRFSFDFPSEMLVTGDQIELKTTDNSLLSFIGPDGWPTSQVYKDGIFYIYVDEAGGIRLYRAFEDAIAGEVTGRVSLTDPGRTVPVRVTIRNNNQRILGQVKSYELNTERDTIDLTNLSDEFRKNYSGLISGSGRITCFFDYTRRPLDPMLQQASGSIELSMYVHQLLLRTRLGSEFKARLFLVTRGSKPYSDAADADNEIWYEFDARVSNVGIAFEPDGPIESTIEFVTTGRIRLRTRYVTNYLVQEDLGRIRQEANQTGFIELEQQD